MSLNRQFGYVFGAVYLLVGIVGFFLTGFDGFAATEGPQLIVFRVNPLHNIVHLLVGALLLAGAAGGVQRAKSVNILVGAVYLLVAIVGPFITGTELNILALNTADHILHALTAVLALAVGLKGEEMMAAA